MCSIAGVALPAGCVVPRLPVPPQSCGRCNDYLPHTSTLERFVWVARFYAANGAALHDTYPTSSFTLLFVAFIHISKVYSLRAAISAPKLFLSTLPGSAEVARLQLTEMMAHASRANSILRGWDSPLLSSARKGSLKCPVGLHVSQV